MTPTIRRATRADMKRLGELGALLVRTHYDFDPKRFLAPSPQTPAGYGSFLASQIDDPDSTLLVADADGEVLGYIFATNEGIDYMSLRGPAGIIQDIVVDPAHRGRGIGAMLLDAAIGVLREHGAPRVVLSTADRNEAAQRLFEKAGFRRTMIEMTREID